MDLKNKENIKLIKKIAKRYNIKVKENAPVGGIFVEGNPLEENVHDKIIEDFLKEGVLDGLQREEKINKG